MKKRLLAIIICVIAIIGGAIGFTGCSPENGAYYLMENGELKTEHFFKLNSGKFLEEFPLPLRRKRSIFSVIRLPSSCILRDYFKL